MYSQRDKSIFGYSETINTTKEESSYPDITAINILETVIYTAFNFGALILGVARKYEM